MTDPAAEDLKQGLAHQQAGRLPEAEHFYRRVLQSQPNHAPACHLMGLVAYQGGNPDQAVQWIGRALMIDSFNVAFAVDLGHIQRDLGRYPEAIAAFQLALRADPENAENQNHLGTLYQTVGNLPRAIELFRKALELDASLAYVHCNLATALQRSGQLDEAGVAYEESIRLDPRSADTYFHLGTYQRLKGDPLAAIACFQRALALDPDMAEARHQLAQVRLSRGEFAQGFIDFEWRPSGPLMVKPLRKAPLWKGEPLEGRRILLYAEQSLEDVLFFVRYMPLVAAAGGRVGVDVPAEWLPFLAACGLPNLLSFQESVACDLQAPLASLPRLIGTRLDTIPAQQNYLQVRDDLASPWREALAKLPGLRVGLGGFASAAAFNPFLGTPPLEAFAPLAQVPGVTLVDLRSNSGDDPLESLDRPFEMSPLEALRPAESAEQAGDAARLIEVAAVISALDLVMTSDGLLAQLAGALGRPVWHLLPLLPDWRWLDEREDSPWYPTMRLFRRSSVDTAGEVIERVRQSLVVHASEPQAAE